MYGNAMLWREDNHKLLAMLSSSKMHAEHFKMLCRCNRLVKWQKAKKSTQCSSYNVHVVGRTARSLHVANNVSTSRYLLFFSVEFFTLAHNTRHRLTKQAAEYLPVSVTYCNYRCSNWKQGSLNYGDLTTFCLLGELCSYKTKAYEMSPFPWLISCAIYILQFWFHRPTDSVAEWSSASVQCKSRFRTPVRSLPPSKKNFADTPMCVKMFMLNVVLLQPRYVFMVCLFLVVNESWVCSICNFYSHTLFSWLEDTLQTLHCHPSYDSTFYYNI